jgi:hypothetical protein
MVKEIAGCPEIKGVRGTDKRKYLIDLMRIYPRDANYKDVSNESVCLIREELLMIREKQSIHNELSIK